MSKNNSINFLWGFLFLAFGILLIGNICGYWYVDIPYYLFYRGFWTFFIILPCLVSLCQKGFQVSTLTAVVVSLLLFAAKQGLFDLTTAKKLILPFILIIIGLSFFIACFSPDETENGNLENEETTSSKTYSALFGSTCANFDEKSFAGCSLSALLGETRLNIEHAYFENDSITIEASAIFGTIDIHLPEEINVKVKATPLLGGIHNYKRRTEVLDNVPTIYINATCILGGIDIR